MSARRTTTATATPRVRLRKAEHTELKARLEEIARNAGAALEWLEGGARTSFSEGLALALDYVVSDTEELEHVFKDLTRRQQEAEDASRRRPTRSAS